MKIAIGSTNPTKIQAAERSARKVWPDAEFVAVAVPSGVAEQPMSDEETIQGALNRAREALTVAAADVGIGVEGGVDDSPMGMFATGWAVVVDNQGTVGIGGSGRLPLPESIAARIRAGGELGPVMDQFAGRSNLKHSLGAVGILTDGQINRTEALQVAVTYALTKFMHPEYYDERPMTEDQ
jgi:inosine/xanthosine triphosphatase